MECNLSRIAKIVPFQTKDLVAMVTMDELSYPRGTCMCSLGGSDMLHVGETGGLFHGFSLATGSLHNLHIIT